MWSAWHRWVMQKASGILRCTLTLMTLSLIFQAGRDKLYLIKRIKQGMSMPVDANLQWFPSALNESCHPSLIYCNIFHLDAHTILSRSLGFIHSSNLRCKICLIIIEKKYSDSQREERTCTPGPLSSCHSFLDHVIFFCTKPIFWISHEYHNDWLKMCASWCYILGCYSYFL